MEEWSVKECTRRFKNFFEESFTPRKLANSTVRQIIISHYHSKYTTKGITRALQNNFSDHLLFGGAGSKSKYGIKVTVTTTSMDQQVGLNSQTISAYITSFILNPYSHYY